MDRRLRRGARIRARAGRHRRARDTADETLYYFEKPHKWQTVRDAWEAAGRPRDSSDTGWDAFLHELEELAGL